MCQLMALYLFSSVLWHCLWIWHNLWFTAWLDWPPDREIIFGNGKCWNRIVARMEIRRRGGIARATSWVPPPNCHQPMQHSVAPESRSILQCIAMPAVNLVCSTVGLRIVHEMPTKVEQRRAHNKVEADIKQRFKIALWSWRAHLARSSQQFSDQDSYFYCSVMFYDQ